MRRRKHRNLKILKLLDIKASVLHRISYSHAVVKFAVMEH